MVNVAGRTSLISNLKWQASRGAGESDRVKIYSVGLVDGVPSLILLARYFRGTSKGDNNCFYYQLSEDGRKIGNQQAMTCTSGSRNFIRNLGLPILLADSYEDAEQKALPVLQALLLEQRKTTDIDTKQLKEDFRVGDVGEWSRKRWQTQEENAPGKMAFADVEAALSTGAPALSKEDFKRALEGLTKPKISELCGANGISLKERSRHRSKDELIRELGKLYAQRLRTGNWPQQLPSREISPEKAALEKVKAAMDTPTLSEEDFEKALDRIKKDGLLELIKAYGLPRAKSGRKLTLDELRTQLAELYRSRRPTSTPGIDSRVETIGSPRGSQEA
jgi:hypothetical protein